MRTGPLPGQPLGCVTGLCLFLLMGSAPAVHLLLPHPCSLSAESFPLPCKQAAISARLKAKTNLTPTSPYGGGLCPFLESVLLERVSLALCPTSLCCSLVSVLSSHTHSWVDTAPGKVTKVRAISASLTTSAFAPGSVHSLWMQPYRFILPTSHLSASSGPFLFLPHLADLSHTPDEAIQPVL